MSLHSLNNFLFHYAAHIYDFMTNQDFWRHIIKGLLQYSDSPSKPSRILDLGCGPGISTFTLAEELDDRAKITGIDLSPTMIQRAQKHHAHRFPHLQNINFQQANAANLPFENATFDLAVGNSFLYLVEDRPAVLKEIHRVLSPEGRLVLMEPNARGNLAHAAWAHRNSLSQFFSNPGPTLRFSASIILWRFFSGLAGRMSAEIITPLLQKAGFAQINCYPTAAGLGLHCIGCKNSKD